MAKPDLHVINVKQRTFCAKNGTARDTCMAREQRDLAEAAARFLNVATPVDELRIVSLLFAHVIH